MTDVVSQAGAGLITPANRSSAGELRGEEMRRSRTHILSSGFKSNLHASAKKNLFLEKKIIKCRDLHPSRLNILYASCYVSVFSGARRNSGQSVQENFRGALEELPPF